MKHLRKFSEKSQFNKESKKYYDFLKTVSFQELPFEYQKSLIIYMYEGPVVDWSIDQRIDEIAKNDELIKILINDYMSVGRNKNKSFAYGLVPMDILTKEISDRLGFETFEEYHRFYNDKETNHGKSVYPVIIDSDNEELIEDGWHRFHYYYSIGIKEVPVVMFM